MKRFFALMLGAIAFLFLASQFANAQDKTFTGIITDQSLNCIQKPMKVPPQQVGSPAWGKDACVLYWAHFANPKDKMVLYDPGTKTVYQLDKDDLVIPFAGDPETIKVTGAYNEATKTITVKRAEP